MGPEMRVSLNGSLNVCLPHTQEVACHKLKSTVSLYQGIPDTRRGWQPLSMRKTHIQ